MSMNFLPFGNTFYSSCLQKFGERFFREALEKADVGFSSFITHSSGTKRGTFFFSQMWSWVAATHCLLLGSFSAWRSLTFTFSGTPNAEFTELLRGSGGEPPTLPLPNCQAGATTPPSSTFTQRGQGLPSKRQLLKLFSTTQEHNTTSDSSLS